MNAKRLALALLAAAPLAPLAGHAAPPNSLMVNCAAPRLPSQQAVAEFAGIANFSHAYAMRERLMLDVQRACKRGAEQVRLVREQRPGADGAIVAIAEKAR